MFNIKEEELNFIKKELTQTEKMKAIIFSVFIMIMLIFFGFRPKFENNLTSNIFDMIHVVGYIVIFIFSQWLFKNKLKKSLVLKELGLKNNKFYIKCSPLMNESMIDVVLDKEDLGLLKQSQAHIYISNEEKYKDSLGDYYSGSNGVRPVYVGKSNIEKIKEILKK